MAGIDEQTKKKFRRHFRRRRNNALVLSQQANQKIEHLLIRRFDKLLSVRRFVILWTSLLMVLILTGIYQAKALSNYYQTLQPVAGGIYTEGLIGSFTNANPLYSNGAADTAVSHLVFSGLFKYDSSNNLVGDLAKDYKLDDTQKRYTIHLKHDLNWQDGYPVTANDVVFTYKTIQNIAAQSPLFSSWQSINVTKLDDYTVNFDLPNALSAFPYSMTNGIVPEHLLKDIPPEQLRSDPFNIKPVGSGAFIWKFIEVTGSTPETRQQRISLAASKNYYDGRPKLDGINITTFNNENQIITAFKNKQITAMSGLENMPGNLGKDKSVQIYTTPLTTSVMAFFNNSRLPFNDSAVRKALILATDRSKFTSLFDQPVKLSDSPLLKGQLGYDKTLTEPGFDIGSAKATLDQAGWVVSADGIRTKAGKPLAFTMDAQDTPNYTKAAQYLQQSWSKVGAKVTINYYSGDELQSLVISNHDFDALLYGVSIGVDPDVYAYWDSSQASITSQGHLNLSEYKSAAADQAIESARTRSDPAIRAVKYKAFLTQWTKDLPAMPLYQPNYLYISRGPVFNIERSSSNARGDRFYNVNKWMIRQENQTIK